MTSRTSAELVEIATQAGRHLADQLGASIDGERLTVIVVLGNDEGWAASQHGDENIAAMALGHALNEARAPGRWVERDRSPPVTA